MTSARCRTHVHAVSLAVALATAVPIFTTALQPGAGQDQVRKAVFAELRYEPAIARGREVLEGLVREGHTPGVSAAVAVDGRIVWSEGFGHADLEKKLQVTRATLFGIGSISKTLTMAGVLTLVDAGLLDLDVPVETYLPDFPYRGKRITLRRLAAHQSGLSDDFAAAHYQTDRHFATVEEAYREIVARETIVYQPGSEVRYGTGLYTIIGRVLEVAGKRPYLTVMRERVLNPAGSSGVVPNDRTLGIPLRTGFYVGRSSGGFGKAPFFDPSHKLPGAGFLATAGDMARFGAALLGPGLLSDAARAEMRRAVPLADGTPTEYALGLRVGQFEGRPMLHQPGGGLGISAWLFLHPADGLVVALLSNVTTCPLGGRTHAEIARAFSLAARAH
ncbi:MAG TPA: serine hydrolase domain-containing protein [Vicinamibacterales bacterium]|nr:serine hydrolase domain-containing protein [Vicinamibacterales bacterium]